MCLIPYAVLDRLVAEGVDVHALFEASSDAEGNDHVATGGTGRTVAVRPVPGSFDPSDRSVSIPVRSINRIVPEESSA